MIKAIETVYNGYKFRSRLEARWAVFFDALGIQYEYEPEGFDLGEAGWYLPNFYLPKYKTWIEIKGDPDSIKYTERRKIEALAQETQQPAFIGGPFNGEDANIKACIGDSDEMFNKKHHPALLVKDQDPFANNIYFERSPIPCPFCDHDYVHSGKATITDGDISIPFWAECGSTWTINYLSHKGQTHVYGTDAARCEESLRLDLHIIGGIPWEERKQAVLKARQARFEHGERP